MHMQIDKKILARESAGRNAFEPHFPSMFWACCYHDLLHLSCSTLMFRLEHDWIRYAKIIFHCFSHTIEPCHLPIAKAEAAKPKFRQDFAEPCQLRRIVDMSCSLVGTRGASDTNAVWLQKAQVVLVRAHPRGCWRLLDAKTL